MIEVLVALVASLVLGGVAALWYRQAENDKRLRELPHAETPRRAAQGATGSGHFRIIARRVSDGVARAPLHAAPTTAPQRALASTTDAPRARVPFRVSRRAVAPDARCIVCGELLRDCQETHQ